jgi:hypothetical protein
MLVSMAGIYAVTNLVQIHAALLIRPKKATVAKSFPEGLAIPNPTLDYYVTSNNNRQDVDMAPSTDDPHKRTGPIAGVMDVDSSESISMEQRVKYLESTVERLQQRVAELEQARQR